MTASDPKPIKPLRPTFGKSLLVACKHTHTPVSFQVKTYCLMFKKNNNWKPAYSHPLQEEALPQLMLRVFGAYLPHLPNAGWQEWAAIGFEPISVKGERNKSLNTSSNNYLEFRIESNIIMRLINGHKAIWKQLLSLSCFI